MEASLVERVEETGIGGICKKAAHPPTARASRTKVVNMGRDAERRKAVNLRFLQLLPLSLR